MISAHGLVRATALVISLSTATHAIAQTVTPAPAPAAAPAPAPAPAASAPLAPMTANEARVLLQKGVDTLRVKIANSSNLQPVDRISIAKALEEDALEMRANLDNILDQIAQLGETTFVAGILVTYAGEKNLPAWLLPRTTFSPGGEYGAALFLRKNSYVSEALRGTDVAIGGISADLTPAPTATQPAVEKGWRVKLLLATGGKARPVANLSDFEGLYTGVGAEFNVFGRTLNARAYVKPQECESLYNPLSCRMLLVSFSKNKDIQGKAVSASLKEIYVDFPHDTEGRGHRFF